MFNFWWSAGLVNGFEPHPPPLSSQKNKMLVFGLHSTSDDQPGWSMDSNLLHHPSLAKKTKMLIFGLCSTSDDQLGWLLDSRPIHHPSPAKKIKCSFLDYIQLLMISWVHLPTLSSQNNIMLIFGLCSTSDDWLGWSMDSNPIHHPSPAKRMKCSFLDYTQLLMIGRGGQWTQTPLQPKI